MAVVLFLTAVILWTTPLWFSVLMEILFRCGIGYRRRGKLRRISGPEWLNVVGLGMFLGTILYGLVRFLQRSH